MQPVRIYKFKEPCLYCGSFAARRANKKRCPDAINPIRNEVWAGFNHNMFDEQLTGLRISMFEFDSEKVEHSEN